MSEPLLSVKNMKKTFQANGGMFSKKKFVHAVNDVSFDIYPGETFSLVGESGCGKSTTGKLIDHLITPDSGEIWFEGKEISKLSEKEMRPLRSDIQMVFQDPYGSLNPRMKVQDLIGEPLLIHTNMSAGERLKKVHELLGTVGLSPSHGERYPHEFSGGMRQRAALIRTLVLEPELLLLDEPFSALDGYLKDILQRDMQNFLKDYKGDMIMVTHSRDEAYKFCSQLTLLNNGKDILTGETRDIFENPQYLEAARLTGCKNFSAVQKMGSHEVYALDWELMLRSEQEVTEDITHVGIRGHWMRPATKAGENTMEVQVEEYIENTFEHQYLFRNKGAAESGTLWWMCQKKNFQETAKDNIPKYLYFPPEHVMLLKK